MLKDQKIRRMVIFASGEVSNAQHIIRYFKAGNVAEVTLVLSDRKAARALDKAKELGLLKELIEAGKIRSVIDQLYPLGEMWRLIVTLKKDTKWEMLLSLYRS